MSGYAAGLRDLLPTPASSRDLIRYATLAANGHNTQPWLFRSDERGIDILPDMTRGLRHLRDVARATLDLNRHDRLGSPPTPADFEDLHLLIRPEVSRQE